MDEIKTEEGTEEVVSTDAVDATEETVEETADETTEASEEAN